MDNAQREAGHAPTTREQYAQWVVRYRNERLAKTCCDLQSYLTRLSPESFQPANILPIQHIA